jgi:hypothetical protein
MVNCSALFIASTARELNLVEHSVSIHSFDDGLDDDLIHSSKAKKS